MLITVSRRSCLTRLLADATGAAALEYALLLALIAGSTVVCYDFMSASVNQAFGQTLVIDSPGEQTTVAAASTAVACCPPGTCTHKLANLVGAVRPVFLCLGLALSGMFWSSIYNRRKQQGLERGAAPPEPKELPVSAQLPQALFNKRQQLLSLVTNHLSSVLETNLQVRHLMSDRLSMVSPRTKVEDVRDLMTDKKLRHVLVCESDKKLLGVISDRDLKGRGGRTAADIMTADPFTITPDLPANTAVSAMINNGISCLPVLRDGELCGILTTTDALLAFQCTVQLLEKVAQEIKN